MTAPMTPADHVIVIFGANGDLFKRKLLPALYHLHMEGLMPGNFRVIGTSRSEVSTEEFRELARAAVDEFSRCGTSGAKWEGFVGNLSYASTKFKPGNTEVIASAVKKAEEEMTGEPLRLFYLSVPPAAFGDITEGLAEAGLNQRAKVVFEKPFGSDLASFKELDAIVRDALDDDQVYRIDHFLGKEPVQNIMALRFANGMFEPVWNREHIDHIQIDVPEELGIGSRSGFYEKTGALRDMVVTHLFQLLSIVAMEPPSSFSSKALIDEKVKVFDSMPDIAPERVVLGQYEGYRDEDGVDPDSETETFVALSTAVDNWRWEGVPFYLRTGKRMAERRSSITLAFRSPPKMLFPSAGSRLGHDHLTLDLGPNEGITFTFLAKKPGPTIEVAPAHMRFSYDGHFGSNLIEAYERLIHDALLGERLLFTRADGIERTWEMVQGILDDPPLLHKYAPGSWGPKAADEVIAPRHWHLPASH